MKTKEQIYNMMVQCSGPHTTVTNNTNKIRDGKDLYSTFHFDNFRCENALRNTVLRFKEFGLTSLKHKTVIDLGSNIGGMSFEAARLGAEKVNSFEYVQDRVNVCNELTSYLGLNNKMNFQRLDLNTILNNEDKYSDFVTRNHADIVFCLAVDAYVHSCYKLYQLVYDITQGVCFFETNSNIPEVFFTDIMKEIGFAQVIPLGTSKASLAHGRKSYKLIKHHAYIQRFFYTEVQKQFNHTVTKLDNKYIFNYFNINQYLKIQRLYQHIKSNPYVIAMEFQPPMTIITTEHGQNLEMIKNHLSLPDKQIIKEQIIQAVKLLHKSNIAHMDLHTKNICYKNGQIKIIDWEYIEICMSELKSHYDVAGKGLGGFASEMKTYLFCENKPESIKFFLRPISFSINDFVE